MADYHHRTSLDDRQRDGKEHGVKEAVCNLCIDNNDIYKINKRDLGDFTAIRSHRSAYALGE